MSVKRHVPPPNQNPLESQLKFVVEMYGNSPEGYGPIMVNFFTCGDYRHVIEQARLARSDGLRVVVKRVITTSETIQDDFSLPPGMSEGRNGLPPNRDPNAIQATSPPPPRKRSS